MKPSSRFALTLFLLALNARAAWGLDIPSPPASKPATEAKALEEAKARPTEMPAKPAGISIPKPTAEAKPAADNKAAAEAGKQAAEARDKAQRDAQAAAELRARADADARTAAEAKKKAQADARAAAELRAKAEADAKAAAAAKEKALSDARLAAEQRAKAEANVRATAEAKDRATAHARTTAPPAPTAPAAPAAPTVPSAPSVPSAPAAVVSPAAPVVPAAAIAAAKPTGPKADSRPFDGPWQMELTCGTNSTNNRPGYTTRRMVRFEDGRFQDEVSAKSALGNEKEVWTSQISAAGWTASASGRRDNGDRWEIRFSGPTAGQGRQQIDGQMLGAHGEKIRDCKLSLLRN